jgi:hypothetical protein
MEKKIKLSTKLPLIYHNTEIKEKVKDEPDKIRIESKRYQTKKYPCSVFYKPISKLCPLNPTSI